LFRRKENVTRRGKDTAFPPAGTKKKHGVQKKKSFKSSKKKKNAKTADPKNGPRGGA